MLNEASQLASAQVPAVYRIRVGDVLVTALSDGYVKGGEAILRNVDLDATKAVLHSIRMSFKVMNFAIMLTESQAARTYHD